ncbi:MAG: hypothetical protein FJZ49_07980, partial [Candidatus Verstraetearchaeota archaeon]|nr:hypothetical protein [Candidatus Verstraetearchaeota archaeon]
MIEIKVVDPDLNLNSSAYDTMTVNYAKTGNATNALTLNESLPNSGEFIGYIRASGSTKTPANPPYGTIYNVYDITGLVAASTFTITYSDQSPVQTTSITITYDVYEATASDITFDRSNLQYPMNGYIRINIHDLDWNFD